MGRLLPRAAAPAPLRCRDISRSHRVLRATLFLLIALTASNHCVSAALVAAKGDVKPEIEILSQHFSYSHGAKKDVNIAIEATEISGSEILRARSGGAAPTPKAPAPTPTVSTKQQHRQPPPASQKPPPPHSPPSETSVWWPFELTDELTQQELMMILVVTVSSIGLLALVAAAGWSLVRFAYLRMRERALLRAVFRASASASELAQLVETSGDAMPLLLRPLAKSRVRLVQLAEVVDALLETTRRVAFDEAELVVRGLPPVPGEDGVVAPMTFFHLLSAVESLQCHGESIAMELTTAVVPLRWARHVDVKQSLEELKKRMLALRERHAEIQALHQRVVDALERRHVDGETIAHATLVPLVAALRQTPPQSKPAVADATHLSSPLKLRSPREGKDEFGFFLRSFDELNEQRKVQGELEQVFAKLAPSVATPVAPLRVEVPVKKEDKNEKVVKGKQVPPPPAAAASVATTASTTSTMSTTVTARFDSGWTRTLDSWVDRADEMEMTHLGEVKRAQYLLEDAKRESFCLLNSSRDAMQSVESLKASLVSLGADPKAAVLTAAEIYSSRSNMLMLTTTLRSVFDEFRKGDMVKMEDRRRRHAQKEREKRERIVAKFRMKQHLQIEKMELLRAVEREQQERDRVRREKEEHDTFVKQTKEERKQFVWMVTKVDVLIVLVVMAIVFFDSLTRQIELLKPVCSAAAAAPSSSSSMLGFSSVLSSSWWPANSLSLLQCRVEYALRVTGLFLVGGVLFYIVAQLNLLTTTLPVAIAAALYYVRTEWMNMLFRLPVLLVLYGFNSMVLYLLNQSLVDGDARLHKTKRRALLLYVAFPVVSVLLSVVVSITIACDHPHACVVTAIDVTQRSFASLWRIARHAYHL